MNEKRKILATFMALAMVATAFAMLATPVLAQTSHTWQTTTDGSTGNIADAADATSPDGGLARHYVLPRPGEIELGPVALGDLGSKEIIGTTLTHFAMVDSSGFPTPTVGGEILGMIIERDPHAVADPAYGQIYVSGVVPNGYTTSTPTKAMVWLTDPDTFLDSTLTKIPSPTFTATSVDWVAMAGVPNIYGYGVLESAANIGPWVEVGNSTGATLLYAPVPNNWYSLVIYWAGTGTGFLNTEAVRGAVFGAPAQNAAAPGWVNATGPVGTATSLGPFDITYTEAGTLGAAERLFYSINGGTNWIFIADDPDDVSPYSWTAPADGTYDWYASTGTVDDPDPIGGTAPEAGPYVIDATAPTITASIPIDGSGGVALIAGTHVHQFSEPMNNLIVGYTTNLPTPAGAWSANQIWFNITYGALVAETTYYVDFAGQGHTDVLTNALGGDMNRTFITAGVAPQTYISSMLPTPYIGQLPDDNIVLTVFGDDTGLGNSNVIAAEYRVDAGVWIPMIAGVIGVNTTFTAAIDLHNWTLGNRNIEARASDGNWDATPALLVYNIADTTAPAVTYTAPTPASGATVATGSTQTIRVDSHDFQDTLTGLTHNLYTRNSTGIVVSTVMVNDGWAMGSNHRFWTSSITEVVAESVTYWVNVTDPSGNLYDGFAAGQRTLAFASGEQPFIVHGFAMLYNGSIAAGYQPVNRTGATVTVQTTNITGVLFTWTGLTDGNGAYLVTLQPANYTLGGPIWVNFTEPDLVSGLLWQNYSMILSTNSGDGWCNGTYGIPYNIDIEWIPWWNGILPAPITNTYLPGQLFIISVNITDIYGCNAPGHYSWVTLQTNETSSLQTLWGTGSPGPYGIEFDGIGGVTTDGWYNSTCALYLLGVWAIYGNVTATLGGLASTNLAWAFPTYPVNNTWNYTHVLIKTGGFFWQPIAGWNLISVPKNVSAAYKDAGGFLNASTAAQLVLDTGIVATLTLAQANLGSNPISYNTYSVPGGGTNFLLGIDYAYWLFVGTGIPDGVFVPCEPGAMGAGELDLNWGEITAAGINQVTLGGNAWTMVSTSAGWVNNSIYNNSVGLHTDVRDNTGTWSLGTTDFYTGGGYIPGNKAFYAQAGTLDGAYLNNPDNPGMWISNGAVIQDSATYTPGVPYGTYAGRVYKAAFYGQANFGQGSCNDATPIYYAGGFWVFSAGGGTYEYDINYDNLLLTPENAPAPYLP
ncbi:MAG: Ig-like domain-containing protein [Candidatus Thermoplasmatota archaeon]|nr:hypothetical protein [Euryarchaeota archaeon]MBU4145320.1 Ig-like domain-containing protein [Candidatus Thermoplasmatota archaeon]MBU4592234.1 Ig-like domain-containing protein [Candidatus Thermoplasmatota archaeon]